LDITQNIHINVASCHATHIYIDNGQIVARLDQPLTITEKEVARLPANNSKQSNLPTAVSKIEQQQQFATFEPIWKPVDPGYGEQDTLNIKCQHTKGPESRAGIQGDRRMVYWIPEVQPARDND
jgi:hypothetical protein